MYEVRFYTGDYRDRQLAANADKCVAYVEQHFNSASDPSANYAVCVVGSNASATSKNWGRWYAAACANAFGVRDNGVLVGGYNGRGDGNVKYTAMPAILLEPLFGSTPAHAQIIRSEAGQRRLARILVESIQRFFPSGGRIAFSVGHKGRTSKPNDRGAAILGGGSEADFAEPVLKFAKEMLEGINSAPETRELRIVVNGQEVLRRTIDDEAVVTWSAQRGVLEIVEPEG